MVASARAPGTFSLNLMLMNARWFARDVGILKGLRLAWLIAREPNGQKTPPRFLPDELHASRLQIRRWSRRVERSRVLSFGDYRRRLVTGQQNDAHQRCGSPPPIDATLHQTNSAIALQKCRNNSKRCGLKGWLGLRHRRWLVTKKIVVLLLP